MRALLTFSAVILVIICLSVAAFGGQKTGGTYEIVNDTLSIAGSTDMSGGTLTLFYSAGQEVGYLDLSNATYTLEAGFVSGLEFMFNATKTFTVAAPAAYVSAGGGATDAIPGATVTFSIQFVNDSDDAAASVATTDNLPANTTYSTGSILSCFTGPTCTPASDPDTDDANPDCFYIAGPPAKIQCDIDTMVSGSGGALQYSIAID